MTLSDLQQQARALCSHYYCEDSWYSCPLAEEGCANDSYPTDQCNCGYEERVERIARALREAVKDYEEVLVDKRRLTRELDILMNGKNGAAKQASLCDIVGQFPEWKDSLVREAEQWGLERGAQIAEGGSFLSQESLEAKWGRACAAAIRREKEKP